MASVNLQDLYKQVRENGGTAEREPIPNGSYTVKFVGAVVAESSRGNPMIKAKAEILEGPFKTRWVFHNFNFIPDSRATTISVEQLAKLGAGPVMEAGGTLEQVAGAIIDVVADIETKQDGKYTNITKMTVVEDDVKDATPGDAPF